MASLRAHNWVPSSVYSSPPPDAVIAGHDTDGSRIFVGRAYHDGDVLTAKVIPSKQAAYVSKDMEEILKHDVEFLCGQYYQWQPCSGGDVPPNAIRCGKTADGEDLYIGRAPWKGSLTPGKVHPSHGCLYIAYGGEEHGITDYEILVQLEIWLETTIDSMPHLAVQAGYDEDGSPIYLGRAHHDGDLLPAKVIPSKGRAYVAHGMAEHEKTQFELLIGYGYDWVAASGGHVPPNAMSVGATADGETLYFGRGHHSGTLTPGKVHPSHGVCYIPFGGEEIGLPVYEVLVRA